MKKLALLLAVMMTMMLCSAAGAEVFLNQQPPADWAEKDTMRLTALKLGANDGMLLEAGGMLMFIDGGTKNFDAKVWPFLRERGIEKVDYLFNTHPHGDHAACMYRLVRDGLKADVFITAFPETYNNEYQKRLIKIVKEKEIPIQMLEHGSVLNMGNAVLTFLQAPEGDANARSVATHLRFGDCTMLLTADISGKVQHWYVAEVSRELLEVDILKMPHHGLLQMVPDFVEAVKPEFVFINNVTSGSKKATAQLKARKLPFMHTGSGSVIMVTDGVDWYVYQTPGKV